ncbi:toxin VasX [Achromobacter kerstersii]|uniref:toxin VasX n=1 Tax=Achromobacter kerstersii TaxID=1353890 RepID=UPI00313EAEEC
MTHTFPACPKALQPPHPSAKQLGKAISPPPCERGTPLYPLRYGITDKPVNAEIFPTLTAALYPKLVDGKTYGLRVLRPRSYVYLFFRQHGRMWTRHYQVTDNIRFAPIWWTEADYAADVPGRAQAPDEAGAARFLLVPPDVEDDTVHVRITDTILSHAALWRIENTPPHWSNLLSTLVSLEQVAQANVFPASLLTQVPELAPAPQNAPKPYPWSESQPDTDGFQSILNAMSAAARPRTDLVPKAVAVHDLAGLLSELNVLVGSRLDQLQTYSADAARKLRVSKMIDELGSLKRREAELYAEKNDVIRSAIPVNDNGGSGKAARERSYQAGLAAERKRLAYARNTERKRFEDAHPEKLKHHIDAVTRAATDLWTVFNDQREQFDRIIATHAPDTIGHLDLRCLVGHTLPALIHCKAGNDYLLEQVGPAGPTGLLGKAVFGTPQVISYAELSAGPIRQASSTALAALQKVLEALPADGASHQLSVMLGALVAQGQLRSPGAFWTSVYRPIMEVLDGALARAHDVPLSDVGNWVRDQMGLKGVNGFRPQTVDRAAHALVRLYDTQDVQEKLAQVRTLPQRIRFWHNVRLSLGGVAAFATVYSAGEAFRALGKEDGFTLGNALNATGRVLGVSAAGAAMTRFHFEKQRDLANLRGESKLAEAFDKVAKRWELGAIGAAAVAALAIGAKDWWEAAYKYTGSTAGISFASGSVQMAAGGVGLLHLVGKLDAPFLVKWAESGIGAVRAGAAIARLGAGPIGWILLASEALYLVLRHAHQVAADEAKITIWIARSLWGIQGKHAPFSSDEEELHEFHRLFQEPTIETDVAVLGIARSLTVPDWVSNGVGLPEDARTITVRLPGWQPQISHYMITQQQAASAGDFIGPTKRYEDPQLVSVENGVGIIHITTNTLIGKTIVEYRPNGFTDADFVMQESQLW